MYYGLLCFKRWLSDKIKAHQTIFYQLAEIGSSFFPVGRFSVPILEKSVCVYKSVQFCVSFLWPFCSNKCNYWSIKRIKFKTETIVFYFSINDFLGHLSDLMQWVFVHRCVLTILLFYFLKLQGQLLPFLVWSISRSMVRRI